MNSFKSTGRFLISLKNSARYSTSHLPHKVFVYGTLKKNEPNSTWLTDETRGVSKYIGDGITKKKYPLVIATKYNIPFLLYSPGVGYRVRGEIYEVDEKMLSQLDILEDHPNYYVREIDDIVIGGRHVVRVPDSGEVHKCWVYFLKKFKPELLKRQYFDSYSSTGPHGLRYMDRSKRDPQYNYKTDIKGDTDPM